MVDHIVTYEKAGFNPWGLRWKDLTEADMKGAREIVYLFWQQWTLKIQGLIQYVTISCPGALTNRRMQKYPLDSYRACQFGKCCLISFSVYVFGNCKIWLRPESLIALQFVPGITRELSILVAKCSFSDPSWVVSPFPDSHIWACAQIHTQLNMSCCDRCTGEQKRIGTLLAKLFENEELLKETVTPYGSTASY